MYVGAFGCSYSVCIQRDKVAAIVAVLIFLIQLPRQNLPLPLEFAKNTLFGPRQDKGDCNFPRGQQAAIGGKQVVLDSSEGIEI